MLTLETTKSAYAGGIASLCLYTPIYYVNYYQKSVEVVRKN